MGGGQEKGGGSNRRGWGIVLLEIIREDNVATLSGLWECMTWSADIFCLDFCIMKLR